MERDDQQLLALARNAISEPDLDDDSWPVCRECRSPCTTPPDLDKTPLCNLCAQEASRELGAELLRVYSVIVTLPPILSAPVLEALKNSHARSRAFISDVLAATTAHVMKTPAKRRGRHRK